MVRDYCKKRGFSITTQRKKTVKIEMADFFRIRNFVILSIKSEVKVVNDNF